MRKTFTLALALAAFFILTENFVSAQPVEQWAKSYNGTANGLDYGRALRIDADGNAYIGGTVSNTGSGKDITVVKYDADGSRKWVAEYNGTANKDDWAYGIVLDNDGNIYATGFTTTNANGKDFLTVKFDSTGALRWAMQYNGTGNADDYANHIAIDASANIFVTGISRGDTGSDDYLTIKYDSSGTEQWVRRYNGPGNNTDDARTIATDKDGNVYVSGGSIGMGSDYDFATIKYNSAGAEQWVARYNGPENSYDLVYYQGSVLADSLGNVYITGYSFGTDSTLDYATIKYDSLGNELWVSRFKTDTLGTDYADAITVDKDLNVYVTGGSFQAPNDYDFATVKYDSNGNQKWVAYYNGTGNSWDEAYGVVTDDSLNVYVLGRSPGATTSADFVTLKYDSAGHQLWEKRYEHNGYDWPFIIRFRPEDKSIYVGGWTSASNGFSDMTVIKYSQLPLGLNDPPGAALTAFLFPNPFHESATLHLNGDIKAADARLTVFDLTGREMMQVEITSAEQRIDASGLAPGLYLYRLITKQSVTATGKMVIE